MKRLLAGAVCAALCHLPALAANPYTPDFVPSAHKLSKGRQNEVMVLGTPHISGLPKTFEPANLSQLLERLAVWRPQAIAIEAVSGAQCAYMRSYPRYAETVSSYCWDSSPANASTGLDVAAATTEAERLLAAWPAAPSAAQRRRLAAVFLAAGDRASALVQWLRLPAAERSAADGLDAGLKELLDGLQSKRNENYLVAAALAAKLGLERVYPMDDHTADMPVADEKGWAEAIPKAWDNPYSAQRKRASEALESRLDTPAGVLAMYRAYNAPGMGDLVFRSDFGAALEEPSEKRFGRGYVGFWETRNLRMAANIREIAQAQPGIRTLVIVGASHKGYLEAYLHQMHDMRVVSTAQTLRPGK